MASIITQPVSITVRSGAKTSFTVAVDRIGDPTPSSGPIQYDYRIIYDWQSRVSGGIWTSITTKKIKNTALSYTWTGTTRNAVYSDTLRINASSTNNNREYRCIITYQRRNYGLNSNIFQQTLTSSVATLTVTTRFHIFDISSFDLIPTEDVTYRNALIEAANIWNNYIRYPQYILDYITNTELNFNGLSLISYTKKNENAGWLAGAAPYESGISSSDDPVLKFYQFFRLELNSKHFIGQLGSSYTYSDWVRILTHELGHALGIGVWDEFVLTPEPQPFTGSLPRLTQSTHPDTIRGYNRIANNTNPLTRPAVPVETSGGTGSALVHWQNNYVPTRIVISGSTQFRRADYNGIVNELMGKTYNRANIITPLSIGYLQDLGYEEVSPGARESGIITVDNGRTPLINPASIAEGFCKTCNNINNN